MNFKSKLINSIWLAFDKLITLMGGVLVTVYVARYLGPENMGVYNLAIALASFLLPLSQVGGENLIYNRGSRSGLKALSLILNTDGFRNLIYITLAIFVSLFFYFIDESIKNTIVLILILIAYGFYSGDLYRVYFDVISKSKVNSVTSQVGLYSSILIRIVLVKFNASMVCFGIPYIIMYGLPYLLKRRIVRKGNASRYQGKKTSLYKQFLIVNGLPLAISGLSVVLYTRISQLIIASEINVGAVAIYNAALVIAQSWSFIPSALLISFLSLTLKERKEDIDGLSLIFQTMLISSFPFLAIFFLYAEDIVLYSYGPGYLEASKYIFLLSLSTLLSVLGTLFYRVLVFKGAVKYLMSKMLFTSLFNVILSFYLVSLYGVWGAVYSILLTEFLSLTVFNYLYANFYALKLQVRLFNIASSLRFINTHYR